MIWKALAKSIIQTAWETLKLLAHGIEPKAGREGLAWNQEQLRRIDLRWHDLRHEGACRLLDGASRTAASVSDDGPTPANF